MLRFYFDVIALNERRVVTLSMSSRLAGQILHLPLDL
jgi:hypothetical protein